MASRRTSKPARIAKSPKSLDEFEACAPLFVQSLLRSPGRLSKAEGALREARLTRKAHADARWAERALEMLTVALPYPKSRFASGLHDEAAQLLLEMKAQWHWAAPRVVALLAEPLAPHHRLVFLLGSFGENAVVEPLCDWFEAKDSIASHGVMTYVWDALVALADPRTSAVLERRLANPTLNRHQRWAYTDALEMIRTGKGRPNRSESIISP